MRALAFGSCLAILAIGWQSSAAQPPVDRVEPARLAELVAKLGSEDSAQRQAAQRELDALGAKEPTLALLPALIVLRSDTSSRVRSWAASKVKALGMDDPSVTTTLPDAALVADVVRAYTQPLDFAAMPTLVRLVSSEKLQVREAARYAVGRFGKNAIWQLRELYEEVAGQPADRAWDAEQTAKALYAVLDRDRNAESSALLAKGLTAFLNGDYAAMQQHYDALLAHDPRFAERAKMAPGYAALGQELLAHDRLVEARNAYQRALRLWPDAPDAKRLQGQLAYLDAEIALGHGIVDLHAYDEALRLSPGHERALDAKDRLSGARAERERDHKRLAAFGALVLLTAACALLLRRKAHGVAEPSAG